MNKRQTINLINGDFYFWIEQLSFGTALDSFSCFIDEYNDYLFNDALRSQNDHIALTWLLRERTTNTITAYMSLIADAIKLSVSEKEIHNLNYPFKTIPAIKIAKLAVSHPAQSKYKGLGTFMINNALALARTCNRQLFACRFITVDADIEHNKSVIEFYQKNGFVLNAEMNSKHAKTVSMRKDIYQ
ncbi:GNAT family N-acetyltransferase [Treponema sp. R80B11-R83G3]